jgi:hemerythrin
MKSAVITDLMIKDHAAIIRLLNDVKKNLNEDRVKLMRFYDDFKWKLEKHFFTEEKAVFTMYEPSDVKTGYRMLPELINEHNTLLNKLDIMRKDLIMCRSIDFDGFTESLVKHKNFEEVNLYPKLDQTLNDEQKKIIINRIKEMM